ncbi:hypothetical protein [Pelagibacterium xiamenense]|uniref:hypothetical protein n=1 Tax=Pelagibacterium xiamenense TaxID=2901140 RepID=UPI001E32B663|nr:hypothetical protein [Pelagibacterium xiamenense]MCD7060341.1 hypothetical protein [Pelagibacterium xiamenense]
MTQFLDDKPVFALVDDHIHSARQLSRTLAAAPDPAFLVWLGDAGRARRVLTEIFASRPERTPDMVIVDLKGHSTATSEFIADIAKLVHNADIPVVALASTLDAQTRNALLAAGADAVFERHADLDVYRREMAQLTGFWVRETATWPIRA